jgi:hypothetical protein
MIAVARGEFKQFVGCIDHRIVDARCQFREDLRQCRRVPGRKGAACRGRKDLGVQVSMKNEAIALRTKEVALVARGNAPQFLA